MHNLIHGWVLDSVFQSLAGLESGYIRSCDRNRGARARVAAHTRRPVAALEGAEALHRDLAALLQQVANRVKDGVQDARRAYQPSEPRSPLNGPVSSGVTQPP